MVKTEKIEGVEGYISELETKEINNPRGKDNQLYRFKVNDTLISEFGEVPDEIKDAEEKNKRVRVEYAKRGKYRNYRSLIVLNEADAYKSADTLDDIDHVVDEEAGILGRCYDSVRKILDKDELEGREYILLNSLYNQVSKKEKRR